MRGPLDVAAALAEAVRDVKDPQGLDASLQTIVMVARDSLPDVEHVGISLTYPDGALETRASSAPFVVELDRLQHELGEGPALQALAGEPIVRVAPAATEVRWPRYTPEAVRRGVRSQVVVRLHAEGRTLGALNACSVSSDVVSPETERTVEIFAAHASLVLGHARQVENLNTALASRRVIGLALGLVMERHDLDEDTAFAYLTRISATTQTKLREVAVTIVAEHHARVSLEVRPA